MARSAGKASPRSDAADDEGKESGVASVNRALSILMAFENAIDGMTLAELASSTGLYHSTILRLCESLEQFRFIKRLSDGRYTLGPMPFHLGMLYQSTFRLRDLVIPVLRELTKRTLETAAIYVREGSERICLHRVELPRTVRMNVREGDRVELDKGAAGKVLLAWADDALRTRGAEADHIRRSFFSISLAERESETAAIAAPVFGAGQRLVCAVSVGIPLYRFDEAAFKKSLPCVMEAAAQLTRDLGGDAMLFAPPFAEPFARQAATTRGKRSR
ncbi:IclR family transcriptional regulator [soil metagenome]